MWNGNNGEFMASMIGHERPVTDGKFTMDGKFYSFFNILYNPLILSK